MIKYYIYDVSLMFIFDRGLKSYKHTCIDPQTLSLSFSLEPELHHKLQLVLTPLLKKKTFATIA
jgi:hypothetical protein